MSTPAAPPGAGRARPTARRVVVRAAIALIGLALPAAGLRAQGTVTAPPAGGGLVTRASGRCGVCHPDARVAFEKSVHASEDIHCTSCHGGNDQTLDRAAAHGNGFRATIAKKDVPALCASCHADEKRMRPYDLPVDQYALYQTSHHGERLKAGDTRVAVCSDCHGAHDILAPEDPASRVYVTNIPRTCGTCHGDTTLMKPRGISDAYHDYMSSVHAHELLDKGNFRAPTCVSCHGVHGAAPPDVGDVSKVCGRCHTAERRYFLSGPHAKGMAAADLGQCVACHGNHAIAPASTARLGTVCEQCHDKSSAQAGVGVRLMTDYRTADAEIGKADQMIARADAVPIQTDDYHARVEEARTYLREALTAAHAVQPQVMSGFTVRARSVGTEVESEIRGKLRNILMNKLLLIVFWFYVLVTIGILRRYRNRPSRSD